MVERIFISYRRDDSAGHAGRVFDRLKADFGPDVLFMDVDAIPLGSNFVRVLREEVGRASVLLAVIGPRWLDARDEDGDRRLDNPNDFVRVEIAAALGRDIPVIPILLEGARIPKAHLLPVDIKELAERNGLDVRHASFHADLDKLVNGLKARVASRSATQPAARSAPPTTVRPASPPAPFVSAPSKDAASTAFGLVPTTDAVIAARGNWVGHFGVKERDVEVPKVFKHVFIQVTAGLKMPAGNILTGREWVRPPSLTWPTWSILHGYGGDSTGWHLEECGYMTYLGPVWRSEYAQLSRDVFEKLGGKPGTHFFKK